MSPSNPPEDPSKTLPVAPSNPPMISTESATVLWWFSLTESTLSYSALCTSQTIGR